MNIHCSIYDINLGRDVGSDQIPLIFRVAHSNIKYPGRPPHQTMIFDYHGSDWPLYVYVVSSLLLPLPTTPETSDHAEDLQDVISTSITTAMPLAIPTKKFQVTDLHLPPPILVLIHQKRRLCHLLLRDWDCEPLGNEYK